MSIQEPLELEGTWEEIAPHAYMLAGHRVRVIILPTDATIANGDTAFSSAQSLLRHTGTWEGDDFEGCLQAVYDARG